VILPDSIRNYLTSSSTIGGCASKASSRPTGRSGTVGDVMRTIGRRDVISLDLNDKVSEATLEVQAARHLADARARQHQARRHPDRERSLHQLISGRVDKTTIVAEVMERKVSTVSMHRRLGRAARIFERGESRSSSTRSAA